LLIVALLAIAVMAVPAFGQAAQNCIQNEWNLSQGHSSTCTSASCSLGCTANDVSIAVVQNTRDITGAQIAQCQGGNTFSFIADFEIKTTSKSSRSNIGLYIAETGTTVADALSVNNTCADNIIPPPPGFVNTNTDGKHPTIGADGRFPCAGSSSVNCGTDYFDELDQAPASGSADNCGDSSSTDAGGFGTGTQKVTLEIDNFQCPDPNDPNLPTCTVNGVTGKCAVLPNCTSWQVPGQTTFCMGPTGAQSYPTHLVNGKQAGEAVPGTSSKCNCGVITLPIIAQKPSVTVKKGCTTADSPAPANPDPSAPAGTNSACSSGTEGQDEVTYTVEIDNTSNFGSISVTSLTDSVYGDIGATCPGGSQATLCTADSTACILPQIIAQSGSYTCTFTAHKYGDPGTGAGQATVTDTVSAAGTSSGGGFGPSTSNSVLVTPLEAQATGGVVKGFNGVNNVCVTGTYAVEVDNTSANIAGTCVSGKCTTGKVGAACSTNTGCDFTVDEGETLSALSDDAYGDITSVHSNVKATTCSLPQPIAAGGKYNCTFDGQFCSAPVNNCISQTDKITATLVGDEATDTAFNPVSNQITVTECLTQTSP
jgi:hypothetical protein